MNILLAGAIVIGCEAVGIIGSLFTIPAIPVWYAHLAKPSFSPPNWVFGPVWTLLYACMGISLYLMLRHGMDRTDVRKAVWLFAFQLFLNAIWTPVFFGAKLLFPALAVITVLFMIILSLIVWAWRIDKRAAGLLVPYLFWVGFASALNYRLWVMNG